MSMAQCWLDFDHFVWFFSLYLGSICFMRLLYLLPTLQKFISFWTDTPLHNNALFQCWIKLILYTNHLTLSQTISYNGVSLKQRVYFLPIHHFQLVFDHFLWCINILFRMHYYDYISRLLTYRSSLINKFWIFLFKKQLNSHTYYLHFHDFYFIDYYCYYKYICYFLNNTYHKQFLFFTYLRKLYKKKMIEIELFTHNNNKNPIWPSGGHFVKVTSPEINISIGISVMGFPILVRYIFIYIESGRWSDFLIETVNGDRDSSAQQLPCKSVNVITISLYHIDGLLQQRRNSIANTLELRLSCTNPSMLTLSMLHALGKLAWHIPCITALSEITPSRVKAKPRHSGPIVA